MAAPKTPGRFFFHRDHLIIVVGAFVLLGVVSFVTLNISFLNPVSRAWKAFSVTDLFFDIQHYGPSGESPAVAVVDISDVEDRGDLAVLLERVALCDPACMGVDAIFEGLRSDEEGNARLVDAVRTYGDKMIFTCKLTDYDRQAGCFTSSVHSFFADSLPIREGYAQKVLIVTSGEKMALYAAGNICSAVRNFEDRSYAKVAGIILNSRNVEGESRKVEEFADKNGLPIIARIPRSDDIIRFEDEGKTVIEGDPELEVSRHFLELARKLLEQEREENRSENGSE